MLSWSSLLESKYHYGDEELKKELKKAGLIWEHGIVKELQGVKFRQFHNSGTCLQFESMILTGIDFYKSSKEYSCCEEAHLPYWIKLNFTGKDFVLVFGEPSNKGGGLKTECIWLEWNDRKLIVNLAEKKWELAAVASWNSLSIWH